VGPAAWPHDCALYPGACYNGHVHVYVDQSGKIEDTATDTALAFSDGQSCAILIPAGVKRDCLTALRTRGKTGQHIYRLLFGVGLFYLLKDHLHALSSITVDTEYVGHDAAIKGHLLDLLRRADLRVQPEIIWFQRIHQGGKQPRAHNRAYATHKRAVQADRVLTVGDLLAQIRSREKDRRLL